MLEFRNSTMGEQPDAKLKKSARDLKTEVCVEIRRYKHMGGVRQMLLGSFLIL